MQLKSAVRAGALLSTLALVTMSGSPALAAEPVAQASATGATLALAGQPISSGSYAVTNDGNTETVTGTKQAVLPVAPELQAIGIGTLAQDAKTSIVDGAGQTVACAGAAGPGASLAAAGGAGSCLTGGRAVDIGAGKLDLSNITLIDNPALAPLNNALRLILNPVGAQLNTVTSQLFAALGNPAVVVSLGAVQSSCMSDINSATGTANIADAGAYVDLPAPIGRINLVTFPTNPAPNTKVVTNLDQVVTQILNGLRTSLNNTATGVLAPLKAAIDALDANLFATIQTQLVDGVIAQVATQLKPLQDNILDATLNKQVKVSANQIQVTALDLNLLPVAGTNSIKLAIGQSNCGPTSRVLAAAATTPTTPNKPNQPNKNKPNPQGPKVPTSVPAGLADAPTRNAPLGPWALAGLGGLLTASMAAGAAAYRRSNARL